jgi:PAT family beta-lactamase induction signal transducer AmpG
MTLSTEPAAPSLWQAILSRKMLICVFTGFSSGLPLYLLLNLVPAWLKTEGLDLKTIGLFALIQFPYTWKFLWSPLLDRYALPLLGRRRGWMALSQLLLLASVAWLGQLSPTAHLGWVIWLGAGIAFLSATQDIVLDAYRRELLEDAELGLGNAVHVNAYRIAGLVPGSLSLILADHLPWDQVFAITAAFMVPGLLMTLLVSEPTRAPLILAFIFLYKVGDSMASALATPFYLDLGFTKSEIGVVAKNAGLWPAVLGALVGGIWMLKLGINRALWTFGVLQILATFGFAWLATLGTAESTPERLLALAGAIGVESFGAALGTVAFVAFIARSTHPAYTATQLALFTSLAAVPRTFVNAATGWFVEQLGWTTFFLMCAAIAIPGMLLLLKVAPWGDDPPARTPDP